MARSSYVNIDIRGCMSPSGKKLIGLKRGGREWFAERQELLTNPAGALTSLAEQGLWVGGQAGAAQVLEQIGDIKSFDPVDVVTQVGWSGSVFVRPAGEVLVPTVVETFGRSPGIGFHRDPNRQRRQGKISVWKADIAPGLRDLDPAMFVLGAALAPTIRTIMDPVIQPYAFEIVTGDGRESLRTATQSIIGSMNLGSLSGDPLDRVLANPARYVDASRDHLLVLGDVEGYLCGAADKKRSATVRRVLFDHLVPSGTGEMNASGKPAPLALLIEPRPIAEMLGLDGMTADRLALSLVTINIPAGWLDQSTSGGRSAWETARWKTNWCHGVALHAFQSRLVQRRGKVGLSKLQRELGRSFESFCRGANKRFGDYQLPDHVVHPFALVHAATQMAEELKVLPASNCATPAVWRIFKQYVAQRPKPLTAASVLDAVAARPDVLNIEDVDPTTRRAQLETVPAFIKRISKGRRELWVLSGQKDETFDWRLFSSLPDFSRWYRGKGETNRYGGKRVIGRWKGARVLRFLLPEAEE